MRFGANILSVFAFVILSACAARAQTSASEATAAATAPQFLSGVTAFQKEDLPGARAAFTATLTREPNNVSALYNLGLVEQRAGRTGLALGLWRKALALQPGHRPSTDAIVWAKSRLERAEIPHEVETWESLRSYALLPTSIEKYLAISAILLGLGGLLFLRYFGARRRARLDEKPSPAFPTVAVVFAILFLTSAGLSIAKIIDMSTLRGTILIKKIEARSAPDAQATPLFDLYEGLEVVVRTVNGDWVQVSYPGASTGWVPRSALFTTSDTPGEKGPA